MACASVLESVGAVSLTAAVSRERKVYAAAMSGSSASTGGMPSSERSDVEDHAQDRGEPDQMKHDCGNQGERNGIGAFSVNEARRFHGVSRMAKAEDKLHVVDDAADQQRMPRMTSAMPKLLAEPACVIVPVSRSFRKSWRL